MPTSMYKKSIPIPLQEVTLKGDISIPENATATVVFAHGSGSSRLSPRNTMVADYLNNHGLATLLFDLLTEKEDLDYSNRFKISLLAKRLKNTTQWVMQQEEYKGLRIGYFGASTGAAAALMAAKDLPEIAAIVSRGGRPDLAINDLPDIQAPTLLIVGGNDSDVLKLNEQAYRMLGGDKRLEIVAAATHLFAEKGAMEQVCVLAANWFRKHLQPLELKD